MGNLKSEQKQEAIRKAQKDLKGKTGVVPNEDLSGSDADKAYNENGDFENGVRHHSEQEGADADSDKIQKPSI